MNPSIRKARGAHPFGLAWIARMDGEHRDMLMDFGVFRMKKGDIYADCSFTWVRNVVTCNSTFEIPFFS